MIIVYFVPRGLAHLLRLLLPILIVSLLIFMVTVHSYRQLKLEHWYEGKYGESWKQQYDREHIEPIAQEHTKMVVGGVGCLVVIVIAGLIYRQFAPVLHNGGGPGSRRSSRNARPGSTPKPRNYQGRSSRGRMWLIAIFFALRIVDALWYFEFYASRHSIRSAIIVVSAIWTTVLLVGIWRRMNWARYFLILVLLAGVVWDMIPIIDSQVFWRDYGVTWFPLATVAVRVIVVWILASFADISRLCSRARE